MKPFCEGGLGGGEVASVGERDYRALRPGFRFQRLAPIFPIRFRGGRIGDTGDFKEVGTGTGV